MLCFSGPGGGPALDRWDGCIRGWAHALDAPLPIIPWAVTFALGLVTLHLVLSFYCCKSWLCAGETGAGMWVGKGGKGTDGREPHEV